MNKMGKKSSFEVRVLDRINELMAELNMTPTELCKKSDIPKQTMSSWFSRQRVPSIPALKKICDVFGISMAKFFTLSDMRADKTEISLLEKEIQDELPEVAREDYICFLKTVSSQLKRTARRKK